MAAFIKPATLSTLLLTDKMRESRRSKPSLTQFLECNLSWPRHRRLITSMHTSENKLFKHTRTFAALTEKHCETNLLTMKRKHVKPESTETTKHRWYKRVFDPSQRVVPDYSEESLECIDRSIWEIAEGLKENILYAKLPLLNKKSWKSLFRRRHIQSKFHAHNERLGT